MSYQIYDTGKIVGAKITHKEFGVGTIKHLENNRIIVEFPGKHHCPYNFKEILKLFDDVPDELLEIIRPEYFRKKNILTEIIGGKNIPMNDIKWLKPRLSGNDEFYIYANYCEKNIRKNKWYRVYSASIYRKARMPEKTLQLTENIKDKDKIYMAAILTTRGGGFFDIDDIEAAEKCAWKALDINKTFHPYNLLGAIYNKKEMYEEAEEYFGIAKTLGAPDKEGDWGFNEEESWNKKE